MAAASPRRAKKKIEARRRPHPTSQRKRAAPTRAMRLWVDVAPGPYGVLYSAADSRLKADDSALQAISSELVFPSIDLTWSLSPEALGALAPGVDLRRIAEVFGRAERAFLTVQLEDTGVQVLGLYPSATGSVENKPGSAEAAEEIVAGLVPILVPIAGPLGALVKGAGVLFRAAFGQSRRLHVSEVAFQRDARTFGWCFARNPRGQGLLDGLHRATALLAVARDAAAAPGAALRGKLSAAVDLAGSAEDVFVEQSFSVPLAPYAAARSEAPNPRVREARKLEELPMLLTLAEAASLLSLAPAELHRDGAFLPAFAGKFLSFAAGAEAGVVIDRDSFVAFVRRELLK